MHLDSAHSCLVRYLCYQVQAYGLDAFNQDWRKVTSYCFPPYSLVLKVLQTLELALSDCVPVVPLWTTQPWSTRLQRLPVDLSLLLPDRKDLMIHPTSGELHPVRNKIQHFACSLSGKHFRQMAFGLRLQILSFQLGGAELKSATGVVACSSRARILGELSTVHSLVSG